MRFDIARTVFLEAVQRTLGIVEKKSTMPILANVLIRTDAEGIRLVATDREIGLVSHYPAVVLAPGETTLSARKLYEMVREIQGDTVHVETNEQQQTTLSSLKAVYRILGVSAEEYPQVVVDTESPLHPVSAAVLAGLIDKTVYAVSTDETRKSLCGVFLKTRAGEDGEEIEAVATDGHRLAYARSEALQTTFPDVGKGIIVPRKGVGEIRRLLEGMMEDVFVGLEHGMLILKTDGTTLKVSLVDAEYPDYNRVIPKEKGIAVSFPREQVLHALRRMNVVSSEGYNGVIVTLSPGKMVLHSTNPDVGEANDEIDVQYEDRELSVGYNVRYLIDAMEAVGGSDVQFEVGVGTKPGVVRPGGDDRCLCIIMPLRV